MWPLEQISIEVRAAQERDRRDGITSISPRRLRLIALVPETEDPFPSFPTGFRPPRRKQRLTRCGAQRPPSAEKLTRKKRGEIAPAASLFCLVRLRRASAKDCKCSVLNDHVAGPSPWVRFSFEPAVPSRSYAVFLFSMTCRKFVASSP
jgi:hypothetical protein